MDRAKPRRVTVDEAALYRGRSYVMRRDSSDPCSMRAALARTHSPSAPCPPERPDTTPCTGLEKLLCSCGVPRGTFKTLGEGLSGLSFWHGTVERIDNSPTVPEGRPAPADDDATAYGCAVRLLISGEVHEHDVCRALVRRGWSRSVAERVAYGATHGCFNCT